MDIDPLRDPLLPRPRRARRDHLRRRRHQFLLEPRAGLRGAGRWLGTDHPGVLVPPALLQAPGQDRRPLRRPVHPLPLRRRRARGARVVARPLPGVLLGRLSGRSHGGPEIPRRLADPLRRRSHPRPPRWRARAVEHRVATGRDGAGRSHGRRRAADLLPLHGAGGSSPPDSARLASGRFRISADERRWIYDPYVEQLSKDPRAGSPRSTRLRGDARSSAGRRPLLRATPSRARSAWGRGCASESLLT